jgi:predicted dehydrogenase
VTKLRVGLAGLDHWYAALAFADAASMSNDVELVVVADDDETRAAEVAGRYGARTTATPEDAATDEGVDAVLSFVANDRNPSVCVAAAGAGKHIVSVKPVARTLEEAERIAAAVRDAGVVFIPGETLFRFTGWYRFVDDWAHGGGLGEPLSAYFWVWCGLPQKWAGADEPGWFVDPGRATGGAWVDHGIYGLDVLRSLWSRGVAQIDGFVENLKFRDLGVEDHGVASVRFAGGGTATVESSWDAPRGIPFELGLQLIGTEGAAALDSRTGRVAVLGPDGGEWRTGSFDGESSEAGCLEHVVRAVRGEEEPVATVDDAVVNLAAALSFYEAAVRGGQVGVA